MIAQGFLALQASLLEPLADSAGRDAEGFGDLTLLPVAFGQFQRPEAPSFLPAVGLSRLCVFHTKRYCTFQTIFRKSRNDQ